MGLLIRTKIQGRLENTWASAPNDIPQFMKANYWPCSHHLKQKWLSAWLASLGIGGRICHTWEFYSNQVIIQVAKIKWDPPEQDLRNILPISKISHVLYLHCPFHSKCSSPSLGILLVIGALACETTSTHWPLVFELEDFLPLLASTYALKGHCQPIQMS